MAVRLGQPGTLGCPHGPQKQQGTIRDLGKCSLQPGFCLHLGFVPSPDLWVVLAEFYPTGGLDGCTRAPIVTNSVPRGVQVAGERMATNTASQISAEPLCGVSGHLHFGGVPRMALGISQPLPPPRGTQHPQDGLGCALDTEQCLAVPGTAHGWCPLCWGENQRAAPSQGAPKSAPSKENEEGLSQAGILEPRAQMFSKGGTR